MGNNTKNNDNFFHVTEQDVVKCYKFYAPFYDWLFGKIFHPGRRSIIKEINHIQPNSVLEIGVGTGLMLPMYPAEVPVTAIDISREMLAKAKEKINSNRETAITLLEANAEQLPFHDNSFDCIVLPYTYSVTPNPKKLIAEIRRVCKKNGFIVIANHFSEPKSKWSFFEKITKPFAKKIGFSSEFSYDTYIEKPEWSVRKHYPVNFCNLSKIVVIENIKNTQ